MKIELCIVAALIAATSAIISQPHCCDDPRICAPRVITSCPRKNVTSECPTCCCTSSDNIEFYNPDRPEPWCTAPPAVYSVKFVGTWTGVCQPDYYPSNAHWSPPTGASHNIDYQMWDACMDNASAGVAQVSQFGATTIIEMEYEAAGDDILDTFKAGLITGGGMTSAELNVDKFHQWVSTVTMLAPSLDRMVGVADLRLCDGYDWKKSVKVCSELFSTATRSERVHPPMLRNSVQWNNCSFGYFEFTFKEYTNELPNGDNVFHDGDVCPPVKYQPDSCRTCCCKASDNVDFFHPEQAFEEECGASDSAEYKVSLIPSVDFTCHRQYPFLDSAEFSGLLLVSHHDYFVFNKTVTEESDLFEYIVNMDAVVPHLDELLEYEQEIGLIHDFFLPTDEPDDCPDEDKRRRSGYIEVTPYMRYVSVVSTLTRSEDHHWVGFSGLDLCGDRGWKHQVQVCLPLFAAVNKTESPEAPTDVQDNQCSFGHLLLERMDRPPRRCRPHDESVFLDPDLSLSACCYCEFILEGQVIRVTERHGDRRYSHTLTARVTVVYYDEVGQIEAGDIINIKVCSLPFRIKFKRTYRLTGSRELGTNELEISENGIIANIPEFGDDGALGEGPCPPYILAGECDDPR